MSVTYVMALDPVGEVNWNCLIWAMPNSAASLLFNRFLGSAVRITPATVSGRSDLAQPTNGGTKDVREPL